MRKVATTILIILVLALFISLQLPANLHAQTDGCPVLWNKLGSEVEVLNSEIGPNFGIREDLGEVLYVDGLFGNAIATTGGTAGAGPAGGYLVMSPDDFFPSDKTRGTVEVWVQKRTDKFIPYDSPLLTIFGRQPYANGYASILAIWYDGYNKPPCVGLPDPNDCKNSMRFGIHDQEGNWLTIYDYGWEFVPIEQWVHVAFVWDGAGINGSEDDIRIYRDGNLVASHQGRFAEVKPYCCNGYGCGETYCSSGGYEVRVLAHHQYDRLGHPAAYLDNIIIWDYARPIFHTGLTKLHPSLQNANKRY